MKVTLYNDQIWSKNAILISGIRRNCLRFSPNAVYIQDDEVAVLSKASSNGKTSVEKDSPFRAFVAFFGRIPYSSDLTEDAVYVGIRKQEGRIDGTDK